MQIVFACKAKDLGWVKRIISSCTLKFILESFKPYSRCRAWKEIGHFSNFFTSKIVPPITDYDVHDFNLFQNFGHIPDE